MQRTWSEHVATVRQNVDSKKAEIDSDRAEANAENAEADALYAIDYAYAAIDEAEYAVLDAALARKEADERAAAPGGNTRLTRARKKQPVEGLKTADLVDAMGRLHWHRCHGARPGKPPDRTARGRASG